MKIVFMGTPKAAVPSLERLVDDGYDVVAVYTQPDRPSGRGNKIALSPVKESALKMGIPVLQPTKIKTPEARAELSSFAANVLVVVAYGRILPETFLTAFPSGAINVHFSLLPKYRGAAPVNWAIVNGETLTGVTTMKMDAGLDTGDILLQRTTEVGSEETAVELMDRLSSLGAELLSETLRNHETIVPQAQNDLEASFAPIMKKEDGLISWMLGADEIARRVRGFQPFPTTFTYFENKKLTLWKAEKIEQESSGGIGELVEAKGDALLVTCGGGSVLKIDELQLEGKRRMTTRDFLNGIKLKPGQSI
ncbi:MAG TPA: methionyl-tRNA formyltransferase [Pyrinomonadaceae bacterium]|jgi:methionyl-tRNA formyltransferase|nr:methionyl-tRNA formyltransferase [Pyrinomonadaceae bacterium]